MAEMTNPFVDARTLPLGSNYSRPFANLSAGGQFGVGARLPNIDAATPQVFPPAIAVVTHVPKIFRDPKYGAGSNAAEFLISLVETHAKSISGIDFGYTNNPAEIPSGFDGQMAKIPTDTKRNAISPSFTWPELSGNIIFKFIQFWIYQMQHPDTHAMWASSYTDKPIEPVTYSTYSMDICIIQPDQTMRPENILDGFFITNMWPTETGNYGLQRELDSNQPQERSIPFTGIMQHGLNTYKAAQNIMHMLGLHRANYDMAPPVAWHRGADQTKPTGTVTFKEDNVKRGGYHTEIDEIVSTWGEHNTTIPGNGYRPTYAKNMTPGKDHAKG